MSKEFEPMGYAGFLLLIRLIQRLVYRRVITLEDARDLVDNSLLDAEEMFGPTEDGAAVRDLLNNFLKDIDETKSGE